jgi:hypothetical protein
MGQRGMNRNNKEGRENRRSKHRHRGEILKKGKEENTESGIL